MSIFTKKPKVIFEDTGGKTPLKFRRKSKLTQPGQRVDDVTKKAKRKKVRRVIVWSIVSIFLVAGIFFGFKAYKSLSNIFANGSGDILSLFNGSTTKPLKGESRGRTNVLLLGTGDDGHSGEGLTDTVIILSMDYKTKNVAMFSIPRDTYVKIPGYGSGKINAANVYGEKKQKGEGTALVKEVVQDTFGIPIDYYVLVNFSGLKQAVDAVGGVTVNVDNAFCDYNYPTEYKGDTRKICFKAGTQTMNGVKALQFSRSRHAYGIEGSDFARSKRQQKILLGLKEKLLSGATAYNPQTYIKLLTVLGNNMKTDFQPAEFARLFEIAKEVDQSKIIQKSFDNSPEGMLKSSSGTSAGYILLPATGNWKAIQEVIANIFSTSSVKNDNAKVSIQNGTWTTGLALTAATELRAAGYNVVYSGDASTKNYKKTVIIDYSGGAKKQTVSALEKKFGVISSSKIRPASSTADVVVILGTDYSARQ